VSLDRVSAVPEPGTISLLSLGAVVWFALRRRALGPKRG
jgi:hypothetical protein